MEHGWESAERIARLLRGGGHSLAAGPEKTARKARERSQLAENTKPLANFELDHETEPARRSNKANGHGFGPDTGRLFSSRCLVFGKDSVKCPSFQFGLLRPGVP